jgi:hypothetical protein
MWNCVCETEDKTFLESKCKIIWIEEYKDIVIWVIEKGVAFFLGCQWLKWSWATWGKNKILFNHVVAFKLMRKK